VEGGGRGPTLGASCNDELHQASGLLEDGYRLLVGNVGVQGLSIYRQYLIAFDQSTVTANKRRRDVESGPQTRPRIGHTQAFTLAYTLMPAHAIHADGFRVLRPAARTGRPLRTRVGVHRKPQPPTPPHRPRRTLAYLHAREHERAGRPVDNGRAFARLMLRLAVS
jgi:hypothetical protein